MTVSEELLELRRKNALAEDKIRSLEDRLKIAAGGNICAACLKEKSQSKFAGYKEFLPESLAGQVLNAIENLSAILGEIDEAELYYQTHECL